MRTLTLRRVLDLTPLVAGTGLILAPGVIYVVQRTASTTVAFGFADTDTDTLIDSDWRIALATTVDTFALASVGLALIACWLGWRVGRSRRAA